MLELLKVLEGTRKMFLDRSIGVQRLEQTVLLLVSNGIVVSVSKLTLFDVQICPKW